MLSLIYLFAVLYRQYECISVHSVNKQYDNVTSVQVEVYNSTTQPEWVQLYQGIARGLGDLSTNLTACVKDGDTTIVKFEDSFKAFEDRKIVTGKDSIFVTFKFSDL